MSNYSFSNGDIKASIITGFSGYPLAMRHWEETRQSEDCLQIWGHRAIGFIEFIPLLGGVVALIESIVARYLWTNPSNRRPDHEGPGENIQVALNFLNQESQKGNLMASLVGESFMEPTQLSYSKIQNDPTFKELLSKLPVHANRSGKKLQNFTKEGIELTFLNYTPYPIRITSSFKLFIGNCLVGLCEKVNSYSVLYQLKAHENESASPNGVIYMVTKDLIENVPIKKVMLVSSGNLPWVPLVEEIV